MAKAKVDIDFQCEQLLKDIRGGVFKPVYLLMGEEPYYTQMICDAIIENCLQDYEKDFNEIICYGNDTDADTLITAARRYPMMAERQLVVLKEAQLCKSLEDLSIYCQNPLESTVLVIMMHGASADKRKALYKSVSKIGVIVESVALKDYEMQSWITRYYSGRGLKIAPDAAALLAESAGADLAKIAVETDKMLKNLPEGTDSITAEDIEKNVGISRQYSMFELTKELSYRNAAKAMKIARFIGQTPKFAMPMAVSALFMNFNRILRYEALALKGPVPNDVKAKVLGVSPYFFREYDAAVANYPLKKTMAVIALLSEYDFKGKGGDVGEAAPADLLTELVAKILSI